MGIANKKHSLMSAKNKIKQASQDVISVRHVTFVTVVEVEEEAAHVFVVHFAPAVRFVLGDDLKSTSKHVSISTGPLRGAFPPRHSIPR